MNCKNVFPGILMFAFITGWSFQVCAQDTDSKPVIYPALTVGIGFFYPKDVNQYIDDKIVAGATSEINTELYMYYELKGGLHVRTGKFDVGASLEYDIAPKFVMVIGGGENISYSYGRFAPEISGNYYIPNSSSKHAFFVGAGVNYSFLKFKEYSASAPGFKIQAGYSLQFKTINIQPYGLFRYVNATDDSDYIVGGETVHEGFNLNYTAGQIGAIISFHRRMLYK